MKLIVATAVLAFVAYVSAATLPEPAVAEIVRSNFEQDPQGSYSSSFETSNGIVRNEQGELKSVADEEGKPRDVVVIRGSYSYPSEEGKPIEVKYYADETGYHAEGDSIPKAQ